MMRSAVRTLRACRINATRPLATRAAAPASRGLAAAAAASAAALYYSSSTAHAESAAAAKTRFDADGFGSPSFKGDVVIVTGGTTGIGAACCAHMAKAGGVG